MSLPAYEETVPPPLCATGDLSQHQYYDRADVWPLNPRGEIFVILMMEDTSGIEALPDILKKVPGIGAILIGEGDLPRS